MCLDEAPTVRAVDPTLATVGGEAADGLCQHLRGLRLDEKPSLSLLQHPAGLPFDAQEDGAAANPGIEHLGRMRIAGYSGMLSA